jgi:ribosome modulation factor
MVLPRKMTHRETRKGGQVMAAGGGLERAVVRGVSGTIIGRPHEPWPTQRAAVMQQGKSSFMAPRVIIGGRKP